MRNVISEWACPAHLSEIVVQVGPVEIDRSTDNPERYFYLYDHRVFGLSVKTYCKKLTIDEEFVLKAYLNWLDSGSGHKNRWRVWEEYGSPQNFIRDIVDMIRNRKYELTPYRFHTEKESNGKVRRIAQLSIKDQLLDYVVITALDDFFAAKLGGTQVASVKGGGPLRAVSLVKRYCKNTTNYIHADIKKCYENINVSKLYVRIVKYIANEDIKTLLYVILHRYGEFAPLLTSMTHGLAIGSALSLKLAQWVISCGYHFIEGMHVRRRGKRIRMFEHQVWYADDLYIFGNSKKNLRGVVRRLDQYLYNNFGIWFKPYKVAKVYAEPVDIAGYVIWPNGISIRGKTFLRIRRAYVRFHRNPTLKNARTVCSYWGNLRHSSSAPLIFKDKLDNTFNRARAKVSRYDKKVNRNGQLSTNSVVYSHRQSFSSIGPKWDVYACVDAFKHQQCDPRGRIAVFGW